MSGAEVLAVVGILANIAQVVDATISVVKRVAKFCNDVNELPEVLKQVQIRLPLLAVTLQKRADQEVLNALSGTERKALENVLYHLQDRAEELQVLLNGVFPPEGASTWEKGWKAAKSFRQEKKAQAIVDEIEKYFLYLMLSDFQPVKPAAVPLLQPVAKCAEGLQKPLFMVNIHQDGQLVGREDTMARLADGLSQPGRHNRLAVVALGGMGKTRVALEYAHKFKHSEDISVFWVHASSKARVVEAYGKIAKKANIAGYEGTKDNDKALELVRDWLEGEVSGKWLMVIDNADDGELLYGADRLADYFPRADNGNCIMTTRDKRVGLKFAGATHLVLLEALDFDRSKELLASKFPDEIELRSCEELVNELEGVPLALVQAAAFINMNSIDVDEYLELYRQSPGSKIDLLSEDFEDNIRDRETKNPVATTWCISFEHIERHAPLAGELLKRMCIMDYQAIPISLLHSNGCQSGIVKALGTLQAFCLIHPRHSKGQEKMYDMHRLVHLSMRNWLKQLNQLSAWTAKSLKVLTAKYPNAIEDWEVMDTCLTYTPHALSMFASDEFGGTEGDSIPAMFLPQEKISRHVDDENVVCASCAASLLERAALSCELFEKKQQGISWAKRALSLRDFVYGERHPESISAMYSVTSALYNNGQDAEAMGFGIRVLELIESSEQPPEIVVKGIQIRAYICLEEDMLDEAEQLFKSEIQIYRDSYGPQHPLTLKASLTLTGVYLRQERYRESEQLMEDAQKTYASKLGPKHPATIVCRTSLAQSYLEMGQYDHALELLTELSEESLDVFGPTSLVTTRQLLGIIEIRWKEGKYDLVLELGLPLLETCTQALGTDDRVTLGIISILSSVYQKKGCREEAEGLRIKVLDRCSKVKVSRTPTMAQKTRDLASLYEEQEKYGKAESHRKRVIEIETERVGEKSPEVALSMCELGINYSFQGLHDQAAEYQYGSLGLPFETPKYKHTSLIDRILSIADGWAMNYNMLDAEKMARGALEIARRHREPTDIATISALTGLAGVCVENYAFQEAEQLYREALSLRLPYQSITMQDVARNLTGLARALRGQVHLAEAEFVALQAKEIIVKIPHAEYSTAMSNMLIMADIYEGQGRYSEAEHLYSSAVERFMEQYSPERATLSEVLGILGPLERLSCLYRQSGRNYDTERIYSTLNIKGKFRGPTHTYTLIVVASMGDIYNSQGRHTEALTLCLQYNNGHLATQERGNLPPPLVRAKIQHSIAKSYIGLERYSDAEPFVNSALETSKQNSRLRLCCESLLGPIYMAKALHADAINVDKSMVDLWRELLGEKHPATIKALQNLAKTYTSLGRVNEAKELEEQAMRLITELPS